MRNPKLTPWLEAGTKRIAFEGLVGLNISEIAEEINTAKSSFYHFFNSKEEYIEQLVEYCEEEGTVRIIKHVLLRQDNSNPVAYLLKDVFENNFENECALQQFHASLGRNDFIRKKVEDIERIRISFLSTIISKSGINTTEADKKARQIYRFFLGTLTHCNLKAPTEEEQKIFLADIIELFGEV